MAIMSSGLTYNLPNYVGELFSLTPSDTPLLSMIGGLSGGRSVQAKEFTWQTVDNAAAAQPDIQEGDMPVYAERARSEVKNVCQIFQYGWQLSYSKMANVAGLGSGGPVATPPTLAATSVLGSQPVADEFAFQAMLKVERAARDVEYTFLQGVFEDPTASTGSRRTRGLLTGITTNETDASAGALTKAMVDSTLKTMYDAGAPFRNVVIFANSFNKQAFSSIYGYAPQSRNVGGVDINQIETDFGLLGIVLDRHLPQDDILFLDVSVVQPVFMSIPGKGHFFIEEMGKTHAGTNWQLYGEIGLEYGPEVWHGKITDTSTS